MRKRIGVVIGALLSFSAVAEVRAATVTRTFEFTASDFQLSSGVAVPAPVNPVIGSIILTFDDQTFVANQSTGVQVNHLNLPVSGGIGFTYNPGVGGNYFLLIGGLLGGFDTADGFYTGTSDFFLSMYFPLNAAPSAASLSYSQAGAATAWYSTNVAIRSLDGAVVPEPATWALMILGFATIGGALRRSRGCIA